MYISDLHDEDLEIAVKVKLFPLQNLSTSVHILAKLVF